MIRPEPDRPFDEPWQARAFALAVALHAAKAFTWGEWTAALAAEIAGAPGGVYYERWLTALEALMVAKRLAEPGAPPAAAAPRRMP